MVGINLYAKDAKIEMRWRDDNDRPEIATIRHSVSGENGQREMEVWSLGDRGATLTVLTTDGSGNPITKAIDSPEGAELHVFSDRCSSWGQELNDSDRLRLEGATQDLNLLLQDQFLNH